MDQARRIALDGAYNRLLSLGIVLSVPDHRRVAGCWPLAPAPQHCQFRPMLDL